MENTQLPKPSCKALAAIIEKEIVPDLGRKLLEFGSCGTTIADLISAHCDYLALTDKAPDITEKLSRFAEESKIQLIPASELSEDCYFGRFHLVYTLFGFRGLPHLVDEIMGLRRLILKGGKIVIIDHPSDHFADECTKQLRRCGFQSIRTETSEAEGKEIFLISAEK